MSVDNPRVGVVGAGAAGAMTLWQLARRGGEVVGYDRYAPGHDRGGVGGETRIFRTAYREGAAYVPLLQRAQQLWRELETDTCTSLLTMCGGLTIGAAEHPEVLAVIDCADQFGLSYDVLTPDRAADRFPQHPVHDREVAVFDHAAGVLRPEVSVLTAATHAETLGATLHRYTTVTGLTCAAGQVTVHTERGDDTFDHVVLAPGPWAPKLQELAFVPLEVHQITTLWFQAKDPAQFAIAHTPIVIRCGDLAYSCFPAVDGASVKVSIHHLQRPRVRDAEDLSRNPPDELLHAARRTVATLLPGLYPDPVRTGTYADCFSPDGHGLVGPLPGHPAVTVLTGFSGHGFKLSPVLGEIAADLATTGTTRHAITHLDPVRFR